MFRFLFAPVVAQFFFLPHSALAQSNDGPPISITSPDTGTTFALGSIKRRALIWNSGAKILIAQVTFVDTHQDNGQSDEDTHDFRLPGVTFDEAKALFFAKSSKGELIPVARFRKTLFFKTIEATPNAAVRVIHPRGIITVILEAISPSDPAMHPPAAANPPDSSN